MEHSKILVVNVKPFTFSQSCSILEDGKEIDFFTIPMSKIEEEIIVQAKYNDITDISIAGPKVYTKGIQKKIQKAEIATYNENRLNIKLI